MLQEWFEHYGQLNSSGDDINIIQVGRPAARYHNHRRFHMIDEGVNYDVHDFPCGELGLKWGGFMALSGTEKLGIYAEQESDVADVDTEEDEAEEVDMDFTFSSDSASSSSST